MRQESLEFSALQKSRVTLRKSETKRTHNLGSFCHIKLQFGFELLAMSFLIFDRFSLLTNQIIRKINYSFKLLIRGEQTERRIHSAPGSMRGDIPLSLALALKVKVI